MLFHETATLSNPICDIADGAKDKPIIIIIGPTIIGGNNYLSISFQQILL